MKIAVVGKIRSGKDSFANYFVQKGFVEHKFGAGIAEVIQKYFPEEWAKGKPRHLYQEIGQHFRGLDEDVWIKYLASKLNEQHPVIITDVRQENEVKWLKENGFILIKVEAPDELRIERMFKAGDIVDDYSLQMQMNHPTELSVDRIMCDYFIYNDGSLEDLEAKAKSLYKVLVSKWYEKF